MLFTFFLILQIQYSDRTRSIHSDFLVEKPVLGYPELKKNVYKTLVTLGSKPLIWKKITSNMFFKFEKWAGHFVLKSMKVNPNYGKRFCLNKKTASTVSTFINRPRLRTSSRYYTIQSIPQECTIYMFYTAFSSTHTINFILPNLLELFILG